MRWSSWRTDPALVALADQRLELPATADTGGPSRAPHHQWSADRHAGTAAGGAAVLPAGESGLPRGPAPPSPPRPASPSLQRPGG